MPAVLFVCTANQFRSPIAALYFAQAVKYEDDSVDWDIASAGTWTIPDLPAPPFSRRVANLLGLEGLEAHVSRQIDSDLVKKYHLVVVMEKSHREALLSEFPGTGDRVQLLSELATGIAYDVPDPVNPDTNPEDVGREIKNLILRGKHKILDLAREIARASQ